MMCRCQGCTGRRRTNSSYLQHIGETALQVAKEESTGDECRDRIGGDDREVVEAGYAVGEQAVAISAHHEGQRVQVQDEADARGDLLLGDENRRYPKPE